MKNVSYLRPEFFRNKVDANAGKQNGFNAQTLANSVGNKEILDHNKKREIESKLYELQETIVQTLLNRLEPVMPYLRAVDLNMDITTFALISRR